MILVGSSFDHDNPKNRHTAPLFDAKVLCTSNSTNIHSAMVPLS
jgi:hypothetical protein